MTRRSLDLVAVSELVLAGALWGFGFVAAVWALRDFGMFTIGTLRCAIAFVVGMMICLTIPRLRRALSWSQFRLAMWPGFFITLTLILQTWGLRYTTATKSGFITCIYILIVPVMERILLGRRIPKYHFAFVLLALLGMALICDLPQYFMTPRADAAGFDPREAWNIGDWLTLACAFAASLQIVWFGKIHSKIKSSFVFNIYQTFWAGLIPCCLMFIFETLPSHVHALPFWGLMSLALGSTMIAFALQVRAQKKIAPSLASLLYLLESPFAAFFGIFFLGERFTFQNGLGCTIIIFALGASVLVAQGSAPEVN